MCKVPARNRRTILCWERSGNRTAVGGSMPPSRSGLVKAHVPDLASMGQPVRLSSLIITIRDRILMILGPKCPYRVGDAVVGDDPYNGRHEGIVMTSRGSSVELSTATGVFFYDHRHLRRQD